MTANTVVTLSSGSTQLASFTVPADYGTNGSAMLAGRPGGGGPGGGRPGGQGAGIVVTCAGLVAGSSYTLTYGATTATVTAR